MLIFAQILVKEIVVFNYHRMYEQSSKKKIQLKPSVKLGTAYTHYEDIVRLLDSTKDYLLIDGFIHLSKRGVKNKIYILNYEELLKWIKKIDNYFEGPFNILPIEKSKPDSYVNANKVIHIIEEGVVFMFE